MNYIDFLKIKPLNISREKASLDHSRASTVSSLPNRETMCNLFRWSGLCWEPPLETWRRSLQDEHSKSPCCLCSRAWSRWDFHTHVSFTMILQKSGHRRSPIDWYSMILADFLGYTSAESPDPHSGSSNTCDITDYSKIIWRTFCIARILIYLVLWMGHFVLD